MTVFHGVGKSFYFYDPDGNQVEVYRNVPPEEYRKIRYPTRTTLPAAKRMNWTGKIAQRPGLRRAVDSGSFRSQEQRALKGG